MAEELNWELEAFDEAFQEVFAQGMVKADFKAKLVWLPKAIQHNKPESPNVVRGWRVELDLLPECDLKREAIAGMRKALEDIGHSYVEAFDEVISSEKKDSAKPSPKPSPKPMANQEQEQEQDKEEANASLSASPQQTEPDEPDDGVPPCPLDPLIDLYEAALPVLPTVRRSLFAKGANGKALRARWRWVMTAKHERGERKGERIATTVDEGKAWFGRYFDYVAESDFLSGRSGKFQACDLGWLVTAANFEKVLSGKYHHEQREAANA